MVMLIGAAQTILPLLWEGHKLPSTSMVFLTMSGFPCTKLPLKVIIQRFEDITTWHMLLAVFAAIWLVKIDIPYDVLGEVPARN